MSDSSPSRFAGLDTLRAIAIVVVMLFHLEGYLPEAVGPVAQYGWMGVDLFFVLSGYLIGSQLLKPYAAGARPSAVQFYLRRALRILPAYLVVVALYQFWPAWHEYSTPAPLWKYLTFTENVFFVPQNRAFSHVWSLCVEEHFYLLLPLLVAGMMRRPSVRKTAAVVCGMVLMGVLLRGYAFLHGWDFYPRIYYPTWMRLDGLTLGVVLATVRWFRPVWWRAMARRGHATFVLAMVCIVPNLWMFRDESIGSMTGPGAWGMVIGLPVLDLGLVLLVASALSENGLLRWRVPGAQTVAVLSYALYMTHKAAAHLARLWLPQWTAGSDWKAAAVYAVFCLAAAAVLHVCVERPCLWLRDRWLGRRAESVTRELEAEPAL